MWTLPPARPPTKARLRGALLAALVVFPASVTGAWAQWGGRPLPPGEIVSTLRGRGFEDITRPRFAGTTYEVEATNRRGERVALVLDAFDAAILERSFRDRDHDVILPPRDVGPRSSRLAPRERFDQPPRRGRWGEVAPLPDDRDEDEEDTARADIGDLPPLPGRVYRETLPAPTEELRPMQPPLAPETLGEPVRREAERVQPQVRSNPLALPEGPPPPKLAPRPAPPPVSGAAGPPRSAPGVAAPAPPPPPKTAAQSPPASEQPKASPAAPRRVRIIGGVTPVIPRDAPEASKAN